MPEVPGALDPIAASTQGAPNRCTWGLIFLFSCSGATCASFFPSCHSLTRACAIMPVHERVGTIGGGWWVLGGWVVVVVVVVVVVLLLLL